LESVQDVLPIDLKHLAVTGCSYTGKLALIAGAFDERIALTIAQESGGGGYTT
jgi:cephalosporin-C deacetylase-like acetyl esterase